MKDQDKPGLWYRVGSAFENGHGDEGQDAKLLYGVIMTVFILCSSGIGIILLLIWPFKKAARMFGRKQSNTPPSDNNSAS